MEGLGNMCKCAERFVKVDKELLREWDAECSKMHRESGKSIIEVSPWPEPPLIIEATCQQLCGQALKLLENLNFRQIEQRFVHLLPDIPYAHMKKNNHATSYFPNVQINGQALACPS